MNKTTRTEQIKNEALRVCDIDNVKTFEKGAKWADKNPYWIEDSIPQPELNKVTGLPRLYLCKCLSLNMEFGWSYTYRIGFVTSDRKWNIDKAGGMLKVIAYMNIKADESQESLFNDIKKYEDIFVNSTINSFKKDLKEVKEK